MAREVGFVEIPIHADAATRMADLPFHHRDPFDRLLIARALNAPARLLTLNSVLCRYSD
jgi:PIN domain nuclease of toxin-antitoxin system